MRRSAPVVLLAAAMLLLDGSFRTFEVVRRHVDSDTVVQAVLR